MTESQNTEPTTDVTPAKPVTAGPDPAKASPPQPVDTPAQPAEDVDFDENLDPELDESNADFDAEEQNPKEATA